MANKGIKKTKKYILNPISNKQILVNGPTYNQLIKEGKLKPEAKVGKEKEEISTMETDKAKIKEIKKKPGCSNYGKYKNLPKSVFCGPFGTYFQ